MSEKSFLKKHRIAIILVVTAVLFFIPDPLDVLTIGTPIADVVAGVIAVLVTGGFKK